MTDKPEDKFAAPPFVVHPRDLGAALEFKNYEELAKWAQAERDFWAQLRNTTGDANNWGNQIADFLVGQYESLLNWARSAPQDQGSRNNIQHRLHGIEDGVIPVSADATGKIVETLLPEDPHRAVAHAALASNAQFSFQQPFGKIFNALLDAKLDSLIDQEGIEAREETLSNLRKRWDGRYRSIEARHNRLMDQADEAFAKGKKIGKKAVRKSARQMAEHRKRMEAAFSEHNERMVEIEEAFKTKTAVQAADTYWGKRIEENKTKSSEAQKLFTFVGGFGLVATIVFIIVGASMLPDDVDITKFSTLQMVLFGLPALIYVWLLRLIIGRWKRHNALMEDAEQRIAMLSTFLALEAGGDATKEERILMLSALFRSHDEDADEEVPNPVVNAVLNRIR